MCDVLPTTFHGGFSFGNAAAVGAGVCLGKGFCISVSATGWTFFYLGLFKKSPVHCFIPNGICEERVLEDRIFRGRGLSGGLGVCTCDFLCVCVGLCGNGWSMCWCI